jgi:hypothetical protein
MKAEVSAVFARPGRLSSLMGIIRLYTARGEARVAVLIYLRNLSPWTECKRYRQSARERAKG